LNERTQGKHVVEAGRDGDQHLPSEGASLESGGLTKDGSDTSSSSDGPTEQGETDDGGNDGFGEEPPPKLVDWDPDGGQREEPVDDKTENVGGGSLGVCWHLVGDVGD
jgi:hypothetical protein